MPTERTRPAEKLQRKRTGAGAGGKITDERLDHDSVGSFCAMVAPVSVTRKLPPLVVTTPELKLLFVPVGS